MVARPVLGSAIDRATVAGRPLFAANREVAEPDDPVAALWQLATTHREHRGDRPCLSSAFAPSIPT